MKIRRVLQEKATFRSGESSLGMGVKIEEFHVRFRQAFHREMTPEEQRFLHLAEQILRGGEKAEKDETSETLWLHPTTDY